MREYYILGAVIAGFAAIGVIVWWWMGVLDGREKAAENKGPQIH